MNILNILDKKGFRMWYDEDFEMYCAEKEGWNFMANSPSKLLGLVTIYECKQPVKYKNYWWKDNDIDLLECLNRRKPNYISVCNK